MLLIPKLILISRIAITRIKEHVTKMHTKLPNDINNNK